MRTYELYLIQEEIAHMYFGREMLLFDLFSRFSEPGSLSEKKVLYKQMKYITMPIQTLKIHYRMEQALKNYEVYERIQHTHTIQQGKEHGAITIKPRHISMRTSGNVEMETAFFEVLRKCELTFLAMNYESKQYGWLNPLKQAQIYL
ncbi:1-phosphatidylinositol phosphodiesterase [Bacillus manliponensis]|uniref:1-phosphatidylinositol phosphodiesterase n=1 Tax=Bacillus manliponensis TaxID=574376 RepID=A0A073JXD5_9BACI|nr:sporulation inhibitor of replication protein SirA [Bacillus manliponensis]KEK18872.1 1-phosphatidylinositol phosphodiesterase [Bacillus manliponensis]